MTSALPSWPVSCFWRNGTTLAFRYWRIAILDCLVHNACKINLKGDRCAKENQIWQPPWGLSNNTLTPRRYGSNGWQLSRGLGGRFQRNAQLPYSGLVCMPLHSPGLIVCVSKARDIRHYLTLTGYSEWAHKLCASQFWVCEKFEIIAIPIY